MEAKAMDHFRTPTMLVVWPDDSPESPHYVATPLWNCRPDPLHWLATLAAQCTILDDAGTVVAGNPPDHARVVIPDKPPTGHAAGRLAGYLADMRAEAEAQIADATARARAADPVVAAFGA
jgi:hypothetical protein